MIEYKDLGNMSVAPAELLADVMASVGAHEPEYEDRDFMYLLGGNVFQCETEEDLQCVKGWDFDGVGEDPVITGNRDCHFDVVDYVETPDGNVEWALVSIFTNNSGGHVYYIPKALFEKANITTHFCRSNGTDI